MYSASRPMILRYEHIAARAADFAAMTGLPPATFDELAARLTAARAARRD
jgi:hypothetical protein